jgi:uncharacterized protein (TIGR02145 family)
LIGGAMLLAGGGSTRADTPALTVTGVNPSHGAAAGGERITITGTGLDLANAGTPTDFVYKGSPDTYPVPADGFYRLEVWGAASNSTYGGKGGYSVGFYEAVEGDILNVYVGGAGKSGMSDLGGWNGGGGAYDPYPDGNNGGGGGGTDIRIGGDTLDDRKIVAGGGGGGIAVAATGIQLGHGGGLEANEAFFVLSGVLQTNIFGGTQTDGGWVYIWNNPGSANCTGSGTGVFGQGGAARRAGGGGGWYGGGAACYIGSGGSGYIGDVVGYGDVVAETIGGNMEFPSVDGGRETGHAGDGYARITPLDQLPIVLVGGAACTDVTVVSDTELNCLTPSGTAGATVDVSVSTAGGSDVLTGEFSYDEILPEIMTIEPDTGLIYGGETVTITGRNFLPPSLPNPVTLQEMTDEYCASMPVYNGSNAAAVLTLPDPRNGQTYQVAKLADGNCWMLNNLRIGLADINSANHALSDSRINFAGLGAVSGPDNTGAYTYSAPKYYDPTCGASGTFVDDCDSSGGDITSDHFYGYLYNWCATMGATTGSCAPALTYPTDLSGNSADSTDYDPYNTASICPANWRLPMAYEGGDFAKLDVLFGGTGTVSAGYGPSWSKWAFDGPFKGVYAGDWDPSASAFGRQNKQAFLWSAATNTAHPNSARIMYFYNNGGVGPNAYYNRTSGLPVRCLVAGGDLTPDVTFDSLSAEVVSVVDNGDGTQTLTVLTPAHGAGAVDVVVTNSDGKSGTAEGRYTYEDPYIGLSLLDDSETEVDTVNLSGAPNALLADYLTARVTTNSRSGYHLGISSNDANLVCSTTGDVIEPLATAGDMMDNHWGYLADPTGIVDGSSGWHGVTTDGLPYIKSPTGPTGAGGEDTVIWFGARVNYSLPACNYTGTVTITAVVQ